MCQFHNIYFILGFLCFFSKKVIFVFVQHGEKEGQMREEKNREQKEGETERQMK